MLDIPVQIPFCNDQAYGHSIRPQNCARILASERLKTTFEHTVMAVRFSQMPCNKMYGILQKQILQAESFQKTLWDTTNQVLEIITISSTALVRFIWCWCEIISDGGSADSAECRAKTNSYKQFPFSHNCCVQTGHCWSQYVYSLVKWAMTKGRGCTIWQEVSHPHQTVNTTES